MGSIVAGSLVRPAWQWGESRIQGPDEDEFTLGVEALGQFFPPESGRRAADLRRLHVVGAFPPVAEWGFAEALGATNLELIHHGSGGPALFEALVASGSESSNNDLQAVVSADLAPSQQPPTARPNAAAGCAAVAFLTSPGSGLAPLNRVDLGAAGNDVPHSLGSERRLIELVGIPSSTAGTTAFRVHAGGRPAGGIPLPTKSEGSDSTVGIDLVPFSATISAAISIHRLAREMAVGSYGILSDAGQAHISAIGFRSDGPVSWTGEWDEPIAPGLRIQEPHRGRQDASTLNAVSEGAYVPRPRYLENLPSRWRLEADRCSSCQNLTFPVRAYCHTCGNSEGLLREQLLREDGKVVATTVVGAGGQPTEFDSQVSALGPYEVVLAEIAPGIRATFQLTDAIPGSVRISDSIETKLRRLYPMEGEWRYGLKAVPLRKTP